MTTHQASTQDPTSDKSQGGSGPPVPPSGSALALHFVSGRELWKDGRQTDKWTDDPNTRCPQRTFQAGGIKIHVFVKHYTPIGNKVQTRAPRGTDRSPEYNEHFSYKLNSRVKNLTTEWNQKQQHFITHASRSLL